MHLGFSIEKKNCNGIEKKIIKFLGIKISYKRYRKTIKNAIRSMNNLRGIVEKIPTLELEKVNSNFLNMLLIMSKKDNELLYIRTQCSLFIFPKFVLSMDDEFIKNFLFRHAYTRQFFEFSFLDERSKLYKMHENLFNNGNLIYKYIDRHNGLVACAVISQNNVKELCCEQFYLGRENYISSGICYMDVPKRKIVKGEVVGNYILGMTEDERYSFLCRFFEWLFSRYESPLDKNKVVGEVYDCHLHNFIINEEGFHFIDRDVTVDQDLDKAFCLDYCCCIHGFTDLYYKLIAYFGFEDKRNYYHEMRADWWQKSKLQFENARMQNKNLFDLYFSEKGFVAE
jgi:hypothetical protein